MLPHHSLEPDSGFGVRPDKDPVFASLFSIVDILRASAWTFMSTITVSRKDSRKEKNDRWRYLDISILGLRSQGF